MTRTLNEQILALAKGAVDKFSSSNWIEVGLLTDQSDYINTHPRLLRSLSFSDDDYAGHAMDVVKRIAGASPSQLATLEKYLAENFPSEGDFVSSIPATRVMTFAPHVFQVPESTKDIDLVAVMMPFSRELQRVYEAIQASCTGRGLKCLRADDIWDHATIVQDIFSLIVRAHIVVVDFTGKNPNVMYETGIAHTLGKHVVPITQSIDDVPFDIRHHRVLKYLPNTEGLTALEAALSGRLSTIGRG